MPDTRPNILFLMSDQHNYRCLGHREDGLPVETPTLDELAVGGTSFERTYTPSPLCVPARYCLLAGKNASEAGAWGHSYVLPPNVETLPETLSNAGYTTCLQGKMHLGGSRQYVGFDHRPYGDLTGLGGHQHEPPGPNTVNLDTYVTDVGVSKIPESMTQERRVNEESLAFLRRHDHEQPDDPWFLCASYCRPHWPRRAPKRFIDQYDPSVIPSPEITDGDASDHSLTKYLRQRYGTETMTHTESMYARAAYLACVDYLDEVIGDLLATLDREGFLENTIVVYTSDHGEMLGELRLWDKHTWHEDSTRVPLSIQVPGHLEGEIEPSQIATPVSLVDLYPTLCDLVDVEPPSDLSGHSLAESIQMGTEPDRGPVFVDYLSSAGDTELEYRMIRDLRYKYVQFRSLGDFFIDLEQDPDERDNRLYDPGKEGEPVLENLRQLADETIDFEAAAAQRREDERLIQEYALGTPKGTGNAYHLDNERIVDADTPLYHPQVLAEQPEEVFDDYPSNSK